MRLLRDGRNGDPASDIPFVTLFFAGIWLVYLFDPIARAWELRHSTRGVVGLLAVLAFAVVYLWHFYRARAYSWGRFEPGGRVDSRGWRLVRYAAHAALSVTAILAIGQRGTTTWVFLAVAGLWTFSMPVAFGLAAALAASYEVLAYHLGGWTRDSSVSLSIALAVFAVGGGIIASGRQRDLSAARRENARLMVQEERNRMARDLHDILGHSLTVITVKAELAGRLIDVAPERAKTEIEALEMLAREALSDVRRAVEGFREISLSGELARAREALTTAGIEPRLPRAVEAVPTDLRELYAWGVREGVTNVIRHSGATTCTITIDGTGLRIRDNGVGALAGPGSGGGNGLRGLRERAVAVGVTLATRSFERGFEVQICAPEVGGVDAAGRPVGVAGSVVHP